ncbi:MAG: NAD(P)H-hydrate epimerase [Aggregatilineales bacterium]
MKFRTENGLSIPAVTANQMREVDRLAVEEFQLGILQMMENAGRSLAQHAMDMLGMDMLGTANSKITVLAGSGGNGGGVLCCARHLHNHGATVFVILDKAADSLSGAARIQLNILRTAGIEPVEYSKVITTLERSDLVVDGLIGYGLKDVPHGRSAELIQLCNQHARLVLSNDVPSGVDSTTGEAPGSAIHADRILTLAAPKTGLAHFMPSLYLADIGIPPELYQRFGIAFESPFDTHYWLRLTDVID